MFSKHWQIIDTGPDRASAVMDKDVGLFHDLRTQQQGILHFYDWLHPAATYGCFIDPQQVLLSTEGLDLGKRMTGGGVTFHVADFAFSVLVPSTHASFRSDPSDVLHQYHYINTLVCRALQHVFPGHYEILQQQDTSEFKNFCMTKGTKYDVLCEGKKAIGAAQRTKKFGYLHQGSISLALPRREFLEKYLSGFLVDKMMHFTATPLGESWDEPMLHEARRQLKAAMITVFQEDQ